MRHPPLRRQGDILVQLCLVNICIKQSLGFGADSTGIASDRAGPAKSLHLQTKAGLSQHVSGHGTCPGVRPCCGPALNRLLSWPLSKRWSYVELPPDQQRELCMSAQIGQCVRTRRQSFYCLQPTQSVQGLVDTRWSGVRDAARFRPAPFQNPTLLRRDPSEYGLHMSLGISNRSCHEIVLNLYH